MADVTTATPSDHSKFVLALLVIAAASGLLLLGRLDGAQWVSTVTWTVAAFMVGQAAFAAAQGWATQTVVKANSKGASTT